MDSPWCFAVGSAVYGGHISGSGGCGRLNLELHRCSSDGSSRVPRRAGSTCIPNRNYGRGYQWHAVRGRSEGSVDYLICRIRWVRLTPGTVLVTKPPSSRRAVWAMSHPGTTGVLTGFACFLGGLVFQQPIPLSISVSVLLGAVAWLGWRKGGWAYRLETRRYAGLDEGEEQ